jgi:hypothetical protein
MTSPSDLGDLERAVVVLQLAHCARLGAQQFVAAHHLAVLLGADTGWFLETAVLAADLAHDLDHMTSKEIKP